MRVQQLSVDRIVIHQVFKRTEDGKKVDPILTHEYTRFGPAAMRAFHSRVRDALGQGSKAVKMEIVDHSPASIPCLIHNIIGLPDDDFAAATFDIARKLVDAQSRKSIPGGIVVVFTGTHGIDKKLFLGIMKAEIHSGYEKKVDPVTKEISLEYVEELLLTPGTKLYKTAAFFVENNVHSENLNDIYHTLISDYQITAVDGKSAAKYFYYDFLGCGYPKTSASMTKAFFDHTTDFIDKLDLLPEEKSEKINALNTYLKVNKQDVIEPEVFSEQYFTLEQSEQYLNYLEDHNFETNAFPKDIEFIKNKLKLRKIMFSRNVKVTAPSDAFDNYVEVKTIDGEPDANGNKTIWTQIIVKDKVVSQE